MNGSDASDHAAGLSAQGLPLRAAWAKRNGRCWKSVQHLLKGEDHAIAHGFLGSHMLDEETGDAWSARPIAR